jgi:hypothetical protein
MNVWRARISVLGSVSARDAHGNRRRKFVLAWGNQDENNCGDDDVVVRVEGLTSYDVKVLASHVWAPWLNFQVDWMCRIV